MIICNNVWRTRVATTQYRTQALEEALLNSEWQPLTQQLVDGPGWSQEGQLVLA
jgi:hypothetical protein